MSFELILEGGHYDGVAQHVASFRSVLLLCVGFTMTLLWRQDFVSLLIAIM